MKSSQMFLFSVSMMNQDEKVRGTIKWHYATYAVILMTKRLKTTTAVFISAKDPNAGKVINPTSITIGTHQ